MNKLFFLFGMTLFIKSLTGQVTLDVKVFLEGPFGTTEMTTILNSSGQIPLEQPYHISPWNYDGTEQVPVIPGPEVVDWVLVELRETPGNASTAFSGSVIDRQAAFILKNGNIRSPDGISLPSFNRTILYNLYVVVYHRNHLSVMSANSLAQSGGVYPYDFTNSSDQAYGGDIAHKLIAPGLWGMISGDGNGDGQVSAMDKNDIWIVQAGSSGYLRYKLSN